MAILGAIFFKEKIGIQQIAGIAVSFFGLMLLVGKGDFSRIDLIQNKGDLLVITSSFTWSVYSIVSKKAAIGFFTSFINTLSLCYNGNCYRPFYLEQK